MRTTTRVAVAGIMVAISSAAYGQEPATVADLLAKGGKKLTKAEVQALYSGALVSGDVYSTVQNIAFKSRTAADGSVTGDVCNNENPERPAIKIAGTWEVNDLGQYCSDIKNTRVEFKDCGYYYTLDGRFYAGSTGEPSARLVERKFER
jgi:hypothetical protein